MTGITTGLITPARFNALLEARIPLAFYLGIRAEEIGDGDALLRLPYSARCERPGPVVSGPSFFALADHAMYAAALSVVGEGEPVTSDLTIYFMRAVKGEDVLARCQVVARDGNRLNLRCSCYAASTPDKIACVATGNYIPV